MTGCTQGFIGRKNEWVREPCQYFGELAMEFYVRQIDIEVWGKWNK